MQTAFTGISVNRIRIGIAILAAVFIVGILLLAAVPPVSRDALTHHLAVPKLYLAQGGIVEIPDCPFSYYPMNLDLLYLLPLYWGNDILPKYIHFFFGLLTAILIFFYLKRRLDGNYGLLGVLLFISIPVIIKLSITVYVDLGLIFFTTAALFAFVKWIETGFRRRYLVLSALSCGLALGTKYNGLIVFFLLTLFVPFAYSVNNRFDEKRTRNALGYTVLFILISLLVFSPWMIRNIAWKGNPLFPLFNSMFQPKAVSSERVPARESGDRPANLGNHFTFRTQVYDETPVDIALIPARVFFQGQDNNPKYFDGVLNPYLLLLPLAWLCLAARRAMDYQSGEFYFLTFAVLYFLFVFFRIDMRIRWISPIIPPLTILAVLGLQAVVHQLNARLKGIWPNVGLVLVAMFLGGTLAMNGRYMAAQFIRVSPLEYISGRVSRADYIIRYRPAYRIHNYANRNLPATSKILGMFMGRRRYYSDRQIVFNNSMLKASLEQHNSSELAAESFHQNGFTHLMLRQDLFERWVVDNFEGRQLELMKSFFNSQLTLLTATTGYYLYELNYGKDRHNPTFSAGG